jgi:uncharacterized protein (UPF0261 family)
MATIAVLGTLDTKGAEHAFVAAAIRSAGHGTLLIDVGSLEAPKAVPDISRAEVLAELKEDTSAVLARKDRGDCVTLMGRAAAALGERLARVVALLHGRGSSPRACAMFGLCSAPSAALSPPPRPSAARG